MPSATEICNIALRKLGAKRIDDLDTENSPNARTLRDLYEPMRDSLMRSHRWRFAIKRTTLAPDATSPIHDDFDYRYQLPADCLRPLKEPDNSGWSVEGRYVLTNEGDSLPLRYIAQITSTGMYDATFIEALAAKIAYEACEDITQSNTKKADAKDDYKTAVRMAKATNALEVEPEEPYTDSWLLARY